MKYDVNMREGSITSEVVIQESDFVNIYRDFRSPEI